MKTLILSFAAFVLTLQAQAQVDSAWLFLRVNPRMHTLEIDRQMYFSDSVKLELGHHQVVIGALGYETTTFEIDLADTGYYRFVALEPKASKIQADEIKLERTPYAQKSAAFAMGTIICVSSGLYTSSRLGDKRLETVKHETGIDLGLTGYTEASLNTAQREYRTHRVVNYAIWGGAAVCAYYFYKNFRELKRIDREASAFVLPTSDGLYGGLVWTF